MQTEERFLPSTGEGPRIQTTLFRRQPYDYRPVNRIHSRGDLAHEAFAVLPELEYAAIGLGLDASSAGLVGLLIFGNYEDADTARLGAAIDDKVSVGTAVIIRVGTVEQLTALQNAEPAGVQEPGMLRTNLRLADLPRSAAT